MGSGASFEGVPRAIVFEDEKWRDVIGFKGKYQVSDLGKIRREDGYVLTLSPNYNGYLHCQLRHAPGPHGQKNAYVSRLIAEAFLPDWDPELTVDHINGDVDDNRVENLQMMTRSKNKSKGGNSGYRSSKYRGVQVHQKKFESRINQDKKIVFYKYGSEEECARAREAYIIENGLQHLYVLNFPEEAASDE